MVTKLQHLPGIGAQLAQRIIRHLGNGHEHLALDRIRSAPYTLTQVPRVGFRIADTVALFLGVHRDSPQRHAAGHAYILAEDGTLPIHEFDQQRRRLDLTCDALRRQGVVEDAGRVWLPEVLRAEQDFAQWVTTLPLGGTIGMTRDDLCGILTTDTAPLDGLDDQQALAAGCAVYAAPRVLGITGPAGTGKTRVIRAIAGLTAQAHFTTAVCAFAGKAADRVRESLGSTPVAYAGTIHKLLGYNGSTFTTGTLPHDLVIIDESSMVTTMLLWEVVQRLKPGARLILVGDPGQLPPVGYGQPFSDLLTLGLPRVHLTRNYRSRDVQGILQTAEAIRTGQRLKHFEDSSVDVRVARDLSDAANTAIAEMRGLPLEDQQLITWKNDDAAAFNLAVQEALNPSGFPLFTFRVFGVDGVNHAEVREGDKVLVKSNAYEYGIFNGQIGVALDTQLVTFDLTREPETLEDWAQVEADGLIHDHSEQLCVRVRIGGEIVAIPEQDAPDLLTLGYAITVHKAQGSDWEHVLIYQPGAVQFDAQRWWYTSVTRAKRKVTVLYETKVKGDADAAVQLWWANAHKTQDLGPSIFVGRVKKLQAHMLLPPTVPGRTGEEWLR